MKELTKRQAEVLEFVKSFVDSRKFPPTFREVSEHFGMSVRAAYEHIKALEKKGVLRCDRNRSRAFEIVQDEPARPAEELLMIPCLGTVAAGIPILSEENVDGYIPLAASALKKTGEYFALKVQGESMINAGILDGDLAIIRQQNVANNGDIVVAVMEDGITIKRFFREPNRIQLKAENPAFNSIYTRDLKIVGVLAQIVRNY